MGRSESQARARLAIGRNACNNLHCLAQPTLVALGRQRQRCIPLKASTLSPHSVTPTEWFFTLKPVGINVQRIMPRFFSPPHIFAIPWGQASPEKENQTLRPSVLPVGCRGIPSAHRCRLLSEGRNRWTERSGERSPGLKKWPHSESVSTFKEKCPKSVSVGFESKHPELK